MATTDGKTSTSGAPRPNKTEVRRARRSWLATYKLEILEEIDAAERGQVGVILRREDLYSSLISEWRKQRDQGALRGLADRKPGPAVTTTMAAQADPATLARVEFAYPTFTAVVGEAARRLVAI